MDEKTCVKCGTEKEATEFHKCLRNKNGLNSYCKKCTQQYNREVISPEYKKSLREKYNIWGNARESRKKWRDKNPKKTNAHGIANWALKIGRIKRQDCSRLAVNCHGKIVMHHEDYDKPLDIIWFCEFHHGERHREINTESE